MRDLTGVLTLFYSSQDYSASLQRMVVKDEAGKRITFLINNIALKPELIADLYPQSLQVELFFEWDQTAPEYQNVLWQQREHGEDANLDRGLHLRADRNC